MNRNRIGLLTLGFLLMFFLGAHYYACANAYVCREIFPLNTWNFQVGVGLATQPDPTKWKAVTLPYLWTSQQSLKDYNSGWFETATEIPAHWSQKRLYLSLQGIQCDAIIWVNGQQVGEINGPDGRVDITANATPGQMATIRLWVTRWWEGTANKRENDPFRNLTIKGLAKSSWYKNEDDVRRNIPAGISQGVSLQAMPQMAEIENVVVETSYRRKEIKILVDYIPHMQVVGASFKIKITEIDGSASDLPAAQIPLQSVSPAQSAVRQAISLSWETPHLWEVGAPYLYYLHVQIVDATNKLIDEYPPIRFGFREVWTEGKELMLNGHPLKLRLAPFGPISTFYEGIGFNAIEIQPNSTYWYGTKSGGLFPNTEGQGGSQQLLDNADERGWAVLMPAPSVSYVRDALVNNPKAQADFLADFQTWRRQFDRQNRPSILMWVPSMNTASNLNPEKLGRKPLTAPPAWYGKVEELIKSVDSTRLVFHHHGGQTGDMETTNLYLNFLPLQEREEFLSAWSEKGEKPWAGVEVGMPATFNFFKPWGNTPFFTEYGAIYFGDEAYAMENDRYTNILLESIKQPPGAFTGTNYFSRQGYWGAVGEGTAFYKFMDLFIRSTYKAWRAWGMNGGAFPWVYDIGFGVPPNYKFNGFGFTYEQLPLLDETLKERPTWANPIYDAFRATNQPLLVYIGGPAARFTAKDHNYFAGENVEKTIVAIWDGPGQKKITVNWQVQVGKEIIKSGKEFFTLQPGTVEKKAFQFNSPQVAARTSGEIKITVLDAAERVISTDSFAIAVFPAFKFTEKLKARWGIYDPLGFTSKELAKIGLNIQPVHEGDNLAGLDILIIGAKALSVKPKLPFTRADIARGLRVVFFEQDIESLESLGFRVQDVIPRYVFPRVKNHPILAGISPEDLCNWRGEGTLLPTTSTGMKVWPWPHAPHWGNYGSVASVIIETPHKGAFTPILECEFDLAYSPLLEWRDGKGSIVFSQLDFTGRIGVEPSATLLAHNLIKYLDLPPEEKVQNKQLVYLGENKEDLAFLEDLGFQFVKQPETQITQLSAATDIIVLGSNALAALNKQMPALRQYVAKGGTVVVLPQAQSQFAAGTLPWMLNVEPCKIARINPQELSPQEKILQGIGPQLVHWRTFMEVNAFDEGKGPEQQRLLQGLMLKINDGDGLWIFSQLDWRRLDDGSANLKRSRWNAKKFYRQLLTNLGLQTKEELAQQFLSPNRYAQLANISPWQVVDKVYEFPFESGPNNTLPLLANKLDAEEWIEKQESPKPDGLKWRLKSMDQNGYLDFTEISAAKVGKVGYAVTYIYSSRAREATFALSSDWWLIFKVNGKAYVDQSKERRIPQAPKPGEVRIKVPLQEGWNMLEMKVGSGSSGFGFWCQVTDPGDLRVSSSLTPPASVSAPAREELQAEPLDMSDLQLYAEPLQKDDDPYGFNPW